MLNNLGYLFTGLILLSLGGEALIRGALAAARRLGVSALLSGLVIVGFGTSAPELVVSINAALGAQPAIALGNVIGSNIANVLLILGICALIMPMAVKPLVLKRDALTVLAASLLYIALASDALLSSLDGLFLFTGLIMYLLWTYYSERVDTAPAASLHLAEANEIKLVPTPAYLTIVMLIAGLLFLIAGAHLFVNSAVAIANALGVSDTVIGLTLVAVGTSLPELTISVIAAIRKHADVAVGNILGSNIFNLLGILGISAIVQPLAVPDQIMQFDHWVMLATASVLLLFLYTQRRLSRAEGGVLLLGYGVYLLAIL